MSNCTIVANPDVSGIGIRVGMYITTFLAGIIPSRLCLSAGLNGFALLVTAVAQTASHKLDLYHAIIVMHQLSFLGISTLSSLPRRAGPVRVAFYIVTMWSAVGLLVSWSMYVWITAPSFGISALPSGDPQCNDSVKYVILFMNVRATVAWARWLAVTGFSLGALGVLIMGFILILSLGGGVDGVDTKESGIAWSFNILGWVYNVVMLELTIKRNNVAPGEHIWSFGQIVPVIIAISGIVDIGMSYLEHDSATLGAPLVHGWQEAIEPM
ncbi:hypothetical protein DL93DRAFT_2228034 [Clavulina sp. PMI_390]|nr:hypothetical protein DL93DRAFT_2228034 [Clavulina sp. PMI_390]